MKNLSLTVEQVINHTNMKIVGWYENAKLDYGIIGSGVCSIDLEKHEAKIVYIENGIQSVWTMHFFASDLSNPKQIQWVYDVWASEER